MQYQDLYNLLQQLQATKWLEILPKQLETAFSISQHGTSASWQNLIQTLDLPAPSSYVLDQTTIQIGTTEDLTLAQQSHLQTQLMQFHPWRKGPFNLFGIHIDTEWRSDWKWQRLEAHISPLKNRLVLDVGCGNGYHCWRMLGAGARAVIGIDPTLINVMQFQVIKKLYGSAPIYLLPVGVEQLPTELKLFDSVFSMGVLYHRRSPIDHLLELKACLRTGGELILETLVIAGELGKTLIPPARYAKMRNVWFLPTTATLTSWMQRCGFKNIRVIDINQTQITEQRTTKWMQFHSLQQFLDPENSNLTCEGLPAPQRAIIVANI